MIWWAERNPISGTAEWAGKSFGESGFGTEPLGEGSQTEPAEERIGEQSSAEDSEVNQCDSGSDVQSEESTENSDEVPQPCAGVPAAGRRRGAAEVG